MRCMDGGKINRNVNKIQESNNNRRKLMIEDEIELEEEIDLDEDDDGALLNFFMTIEVPDGMEEFNRLTLSELFEIIEKD